MTWSGYAGDSKSAAADLLKRAQAGDYAAAQQLKQATQTWAPDHRNAAIDAWNQYNPGTQGDVGHIKNPHHGIAGFIGGALSKLAPAAMLIPGIGPVASAALSGGAHLLGSELQGQGADLGGSLKDALISGVGSKFLHHGSTPEQPSIPGQPGVPGQPSTIGNMTQAGGAGSPATPAMPAMPGIPAPSHPGFLGQLGNQFKDSKTGQVDFSKLASVAGAGLNIYDKAKTRSNTTKLYNSQLALQRAQLGSAENNYASKSGLRDQALAKLGQTRGSNIFGG